MTPFYFNYIQRLVANYRVSASQQIQNSQGGILCENGDVIGESLWSDILEDVPPEQISSQIKISGEYSASTLFEDFLSIIESDPFLNEYFNKENHEEKIRSNINYVAKFPDLTQHLTILNIFQPDCFARAVFCAWFALLVYLESDSNEDGIRDIFVAALCHDLGLLHIDPKTLDKVSQAVPSDYFKHIEIAANLLNSQDGISRECIRAVMEHHEHLDGTGNPRGLMGNQLTYAGQYVHLLDNLYLIYKQHFKPRNKSLCDTIPIIEMNSFSHFGHTAKMLIKVLQRGSHTEGTIIPSKMLKPLVQDIKTRYNYIVFANEIIQQFTHNVGFRHDDKTLFMLQNCFIHVALTMDHSKLLNPAYMRWLDHVVEFDVQREHHLIEVSFLMTNEVMYHIEKFRNQLTLYKRYCKLPKVIPHIDRALENFRSKKLPDMKNILTFL